MTETTTVPAKRTYVDRVADRAAEIKVVALILSLIALPFYLLGGLVAIVWLAIRWSYAALLVGFADVKSKRGNAAG